VKAAWLVDRYPAAWREATRHPFLEGVAHGALPVEAFERWLAQDYLFVQDLLAAQARLLARAPRPAQAVLAAGLVALEAELGWFEGQAQGRGLALNVARHPTTMAYRDFLLGLEQREYPAALTALWALERAYLDAWRGAAPGHPAYREFVEHWTAPAFREYVASLERADDESLAAGNADEQAEAAFLEVTRLERAFWEMAWPEVAR
jgi:formylaminopyrimidine deformylase / aminopyrimidine aminohydrolase